MTEVGLVSKQVGVRLNGLEVSLPQVEETGEEALLWEIMRVRDRSEFIDKHKRRGPLYSQKAN